MRSDLLQRACDCCVGRMDLRFLCALSGLAVEAGRQVGRTHTEVGQAVAGDRFHIVQVTNAQLVRDVDDLLANGRDGRACDGVGRCLDVCLHRAAVRLQGAHVKIFEVVHFFFLLVLGFFADLFEHGSLLLCLLNLGGFFFDLLLELDAFLDRFSVIGLDTLLQLRESFFEAREFFFHGHFVSSTSMPLM